MRLALRLFKAGSRQPRDALTGCYSGLPGSGFAPLPPDLVVEVISPTNRKPDTTQKQALYAKIGVPLVWWVDPEAKTVTVHRLDRDPEVVKMDGVLDGGDVLPGFELEVKRVPAV